MKKFYASSYLFWLISRIALIILGVADSIRIFLNFKSLTPFNLLFFIYLIAMVIVCFGEITKSSPIKFIKYCTGSATILFGLFIAYLKFSEPASWGLERHQFDYMKIVAVVFSFWLILLGLFDFFAFNSDDEN